MLMLQGPATSTRAAIMNQAVQIGCASTGPRKSSTQLVKWKRDISPPKSGMNCILGFQCRKPSLSHVVRNLLLVEIESVSILGRNMFGIETGCLIRHLTISCPGALWSIPGNTCLLGSQKSVQKCMCAIATDMASALAGQSSSKTGSTYVKRVTISLNSLLPSTTPVNTRKRKTLKRERVPWKTNFKNSKPKHSTGETIPRAVLPNVAEPGKRVTGSDILLLAASCPLMETHYHYTTFEIVFIDKVIACMQKAFAECKVNITTYPAWHVLLLRPVRCRLRILSASD